MRDRMSVPCWLWTALIAGFVAAANGYDLVGSYAEAVTSSTVLADATVAVRLSQPDTICPNGRECRDWSGRRAVHGTLLRRRHPRRPWGASGGAPVGHGARGEGISRHRARPAARYIDLRKPAWSPILPPVRLVGTRAGTTYPLGRDSCRLRVRLPQGVGTLVPGSIPLPTLDRMRDGSVR